MNEFRIVSVYCRLVRSVYIELSKPKSQIHKAEKCVSKSVTEKVLVLHQAITVLVKLTYVIFFFFFLPQARASTPSCFKL